MTMDNISDVCIVLKKGKLWKLYYDIYGEMSLLDLNGKVFSMTTIDSLPNNIIYSLHK